MAKGNQLTLIWQAHPEGGVVVHSGERAERTFYRSAQKRCSLPAAQNE